jgi:dinuclear metal center YbgI/SA1388 family protein
MLTNRELNNYLTDLLQIDNFKDYCPNGLQIEGKKEIKKIISGVSANQALIDSAIKENADAILVHHGFFWKNEQPEIVGMKQKRIKALLDNNINLFAYHLPLDAHPTLGNNAQLAELLEIQNAKNLDNSLIWLGEINLKTTYFIEKIEQKLGRIPQLFGTKEYLKTIAFCTGAAQNYINDVLDLGVDAYLSGEISENTPAIATENNLLYISAGHHATEKGGVIALGNHLAQKFGIEHQFVDIKNSV